MLRGGRLRVRVTVTVMFTVAVKARGYLGGSSLGEATTIYAIHICRIRS